MRDAEDTGKDATSSSVRGVEPIDNRPIRYAGPVLPWLIGLAILFMAMLAGLLQLTHIHND
ncbi:MAG: hypothetical protein WCJ64_25925 [Rhodospirillaceae bacterium]